MKYGLLLLMSSTFFFSCKTEKNKRRIKVDEVVDYREVLFGVDDSLPIFSLSTKRQLLDSLKSNNYWFDDSLYVDYKWFNLKLNSKILRVGAFQEPTFPYTKPWDVIEVIVNRKNQLLFERELESINAIDSLLFEKLKSYKTYKYDYLIFQWDERSDLHMIDKVFKKLENGYTLFYDSIAKGKYGKELHFLDIKELIELKNNNPLKIIILTKRNLPQDIKEVFFQGFIYR